MLPHYVWRDFEEVCGDLAAHGLPVRRRVVRDPLRVPLPLLRPRHHRDIGFELRAALEPWHVMGEEGVVGGTARYVDSSLERLQVKVEGLEGTRFTVACNGRALPLQPTGTRGEWVAGVRFRAWQPPRVPAPHHRRPLAAQVRPGRPLGRPLAGRLHLPRHAPGRPQLRDLPVNELEAEGRRLSRFEAGGHTPGPMAVGEPVINPRVPAHAGPAPVDEVGFG